MMPRCAFVLLALSVVAGHADAQELTVENVPTVTALAPATLKPEVIFFSDRVASEASDGLRGMVRFADWARARPVQKRFLSLYTDYEEPTVTVSASGIKKKVPERLYMYVAEARFVLPRPAIFLDLSPYVSAKFLERVDPAIKHRPIGPTEIASFKDQHSENNRNPARPWCEPATLVICVQSHYRLEGKLPLGVRLANKLRVRNKKISEAIEFQSELRLIAPGDIELAELRELTGLDAPLAGGIEQSIFYVNQVMEFGKLLALFQADPNDPQRTIVTAFVTIAVKARLFEMKQEFAKVPVLKNLIPAQVLLGESSFNTGNSISAGLPKYTRMHIRAIAEILRRELQGL